jgi:ribosomal protein L29
MKKLTKELQTKSVKDLEKEAETLHTEIAKLSVERKVKPEKDTNLITKKRKRLAVILTLMGQKKLEIQK